jgi:hypothetical protein
MPAAVNVLSGAAGDVLNVVKDVDVVETPDLVSWLDADLVETPDSVSWLDVDVIDIPDLVSWFDM